MSPSETSLVLLVNHDEWAARSFESILKPHGYVVLKAYTGSQGLELAAKIRPDIVMIEFRLPDMTGGEVCERIRKLPTIRPSTPILAFTTGSTGRRDRLKHVKLGAWEVLSPPFDPEEVLARVERYVAAKRDTDAALAESHVDPSTGFYNLKGLMKRVTELVADAARSGRELGCVVMGPAPMLLTGPEGPSGVLEEDESGLPRNRAWAEPSDVIRTLAHVMTSSTRLSDTIGRVGETDFVIVAPGVDEKGATRLAQRLLEALDAKADTNEAFGALPRLRAGVYAAGAESGGVSPEHFLSHATSALRQAQAEGNGASVHAFRADESSPR